MRVYTIGRNETNDIVINDTYVSRKHAELIIQNNGEALLKDLGSSNGTFVNGNKISERVLKQGDVVKCGGGFLNWSLYVSQAQASDSSPSNYAHHVQASPNDIDSLDSPSMDSKQFTFADTFKYLTSRIFDIGDLFESNWNRTSSILFFLLVPLGVILAILLYSYNQGPSFNNNFSNIVLYPFVCGFLVFGIAPFCALGLLTVNKNIGFERLSLAASIYSFMQFIPALVYGIASYFFFKGNGLNAFQQINGTSGWIPYVILGILVLTIMIRYGLAIFVFLYKLFRSFGTSKDVSINLVALSVGLNILFQMALVYFFVLLTRGGKNF